MPSASVPRTSSKSFKFMLSSSIVLPKHKMSQKHCTHEWNAIVENLAPKWERRRASIWLKKNEPLGLLGWC
jgi:hypothetical protein